MDHHGRQWRHAAGAGERRRRRAAGARAGRGLRVHQLLPAADSGRLHERLLPHGARERRALRRGDRPVLARRAARGELRPAVCSASPCMARTKPDRIEAAAVPAEALGGEFPVVALPIRPPYPPMEARSAERIPGGEGWLYEPKWDGFRCLAFRRGKTVALQSKSGQPLDRYFPELVEAFLSLPAAAFVLDGEIVIRGKTGLDFDALLQRIHPAESRIRKLARETPASYYAFDLLVDDKRKSLVPLPLEKRRER